MNFLKEKFNSDKASSELPVTILLIVALALAAIAVGNLIADAAVNKAEDVASFIEGANSDTTEDDFKNISRQNDGANSGRGLTN